MATEYDENDLWLAREASKKNAGIFANQLYVQPLAGGMVRLNFGEVLDNDEPSYHTAIVLTAAEAVTFARLIHQIGVAAGAPPPVAVTPPTSENGNG